MPSGHPHHALVEGLYIAGFVLQLVGAVLVSIEMRDDLRGAQRILRELSPLTWDKTDELASAIADVLAGRPKRRIAGVVLFLVGGLAGLAANLVAY